MPMGGPASALIARAARRVRFLRPVPSDLAISQALAPLPIASIARDAGLRRSEVLAHGAHAAKVGLGVLERLRGAQEGSLVLVTGMTPTPLGEGKSTVALGLCQALGAHLGVRAMATLRQPSQGPTFGIKGGAAGGGYAQVIPSEALNLHLTGDIHAVAAANNLLAAALDARMLHEAACTDERLFERLCPGGQPLAPSLRRRMARLGMPPHADPARLGPSERARLVRLDVDPATVTWRRVSDVCDRHLRGITLGQGRAEASAAHAPRASGFDIAAASEVMAVLALAEGVEDMRARLQRMVVARARSGAPITADDLGCAGAMAVLLKDALLPTLMQSVEGTPVLVHCGPFADIAHGSSSVLADRMALKLVGGGGCVVTEAGFGADVGGEKFFNIKCRASGLQPAVAVLVASVRALKMHGGGPPVTPGQPLQQEYRAENVGLVAAGLGNLRRHLRTLKQFGVPVVVAVNRFTTDTDAEVELVKQAALEGGAAAAVQSTHWAEGGRGALELARAVHSVCLERLSRSSSSSDGVRFSYPLSMPLRGKIEAVAQGVYGAGSVEYSPEASAALDALTAAGHGGLPICMAKTALSLTADPAVKGAPTGFAVRVRSVRVSVGAGFVVPLLGDVMTIPGLPIRPRYFDMALPKAGRVVGL